jgi:hypothetical protein
MTFLHRLHIADTFPVQAASLAPDVLSTWLRYSPDAQPVERDWEDWAENAVMLHALDKASGGKVEIVSGGDNCWMSGDHTSMIAPNPSAPDAFMYGIWKPTDSVQFSENFNMVGNHAKIVQAVQLYPLSPVFQGAAKRKFFTVDADSAKLEAALLELHQSGQRDVFIKTRFKETAKRFTLPDQPEKLWRSIDQDEAFEWFLVTHEGSKNCLFIQEAFEPTKEYRMIVVGDRPVTGAGCIEAFTPLVNNGDPFDTRMETVRNRSEVIDDPETAERYHAFATAYALEWAAENGDHMMYSLDLAIDARTNEVVAIEMNPMLNLGLYATSADALVAAVQTRFF